MADAIVIIVNIRFRRTGFALCFSLLSVAHASAGSIVVSWNANPEPDIAGYRVHYGTVSEPFANTVEVSATSATIRNLEKGTTYSFAVTAFNTSGGESEYSPIASATVGSSTHIPAAALANISSRTFVHVGENVLIGGFIVDGVVAKKVALRAIGPSLAQYGIADAMTDPDLQIINAAGKQVITNDNWNVPGEELSAYGIAPSDPREAAVVVALPPGSYSAVVSGKGATTGVALFELYDLDSDLGRVANISTRSRVESGDNVMIGGFILGGSAATPVIVRAIGPSLVPNGVKDALLDPTLELYDSNGSRLATNDNWRTDQEGAIFDSTVPPTDNREAAILATLAPGAYSGVIRGARGATGVALFEVYALNQ